MLKDGLAAWDWSRAQVELRQKPCSACPLPDAGAESVWSLSQRAGPPPGWTGDVTHRTRLQPSDELPSGALAPFCVHHFLPDHPEFVQLQCVPPLPCVG